MPQGGLGQPTGSSQGRAYKVYKVEITGAAEGLSVERDYVEACRWYGMAILAGEASARREFDALAAGEVPAGLAPRRRSRPPAPRPPKLPMPPAKPAAVANVPQQSA